MAKKNMDVSGTMPEDNSAAPAAPAPQDAKRRPLKTYTIGDVHASVWARDHEIKGQPRRFYSITFERSYRDGNGQYRYSRSFNPDDLGALMSLCQQASDYIKSLEFPHMDGRIQD